MAISKLSVDFTEGLLHYASIWIPIPREHRIIHFLYPCFDYCIEVWVSADDSGIQTLIKMQKNAIRISSSGHLFHTRLLFKTTKNTYLQKTNFHV